MASDNLEDYAERFKRKKFGPIYMVGFTAVYLGGFGLLWYQTSWKVLLAVFLISYGVLLQAHQSFVAKD